MTSIFILTNLATLQEQRCCDAIGHDIEPSFVSAKSEQIYKNKNSSGNEN